MKRGNLALSLELRRSVEAVSEAEFSRFAEARSYPFLSYAWLSALERSGVVGAASGWEPLHLVVTEGGNRIVAFAPAYVKSHSMGEFVFDHAIAEFSEQRLREPYYPKLVLAVPFTPATGPKVLFDETATEDERREAIELIAEGLPHLTARIDASSAHVLFPTAEEKTFFAERGHLPRIGVQFQWHRGEARTFEDYLARFNAKRRAAIRRERRDTEHLAIESLSGEALSGAIAKEPGLPDAIFALYLTTIDKYVWGRRYLNVEFFREVMTAMPDAIHLVVVREGEGRTPVAMAMNLVGTHALYGRYWGTLREIPFLHFEVCLYRGVEETIRRGLDRFEPGAGGEHKESRGFEPTRTHSTSWFRNEKLARVTADFYAREADSLAAHYRLRG